MVWKAWIPIYNLCDGVGIGCITKFHQNAKNAQILYRYNVIKKILKKSSNWLLKLLVSLKEN